MTTATKHGITAEIVYQRAVTEYEEVGAEQLGAVYQQMLHKADPAGKHKQGVYYTPEALADWMTRFSMRLGLDRIGPEPEQVMRITAIDPSCGAGIFLVHSTRVLSHAYASRLVDREPSGDLMLAVMPRVVLECVFGVDIDPVAVDLARLAVSLETCGAITSAMLERHIICGNVLDGDSPPAMEDKQRATR